MNHERFRRALALMAVVMLVFTALSVASMPASAAKKSKAKKVEYAKKIPVLTYHRVMPDKQKHSAAYAKDRFSVSVSTFEKQMKWLSRQHYTAITCKQLYLWRLKQINLPKRSVLITFDDGYADTLKNVIPILDKYGLKGTAFIIGSKSVGSNGKSFITDEDIRKVQKNCPWFEFQSHTWNLHETDAYKKGDYNTFSADAKKQREAFGFSYLAYPFGRWSRPMVKAYKNNGIKMAFLFGWGTNGYATRKQNLYRMRRIEIKSSTSMKRFKKWCP